MTELALGGQAPRPRCHWPGSDPLYCAYHDAEWGVPDYDTRALWEKLMLDGFQAGLSWITILRKRDAFRRAFAGFRPDEIARFTPDDVEALMGDVGIVRNRAKIVGTIASARAWLDLGGAEPFANLLWGFVDGRPLRPDRVSRADIPVASEESRRLSAALKARGFTFCGPTIVYAFMQACGLVNDHLAGCHRHAACATSAPS